MCMCLCLCVFVCYIHKIFKRERIYKGMQQNQKQERITLDTLMQLHERVSLLLEQNTNLRMKYATQPMKFIQSEQGIHEGLTYMLERISAEHIAIFMQAHLPGILMQLMQHPNLDISTVSLQVLHSLLKQMQQQQGQQNVPVPQQKQEKGHEKEYEEWWRCTLQMISNGLLTNIIDILTKLDEEGSIQEYDIGYKCLQSLQILISMYSQVANIIGKEVKLIAYLLNRILPNFVISHKTIDDNKTISSQILSIILTSGSESGAIPIFTAQSGMEVLIECVRPYVEGQEEGLSAGGDKSSLKHRLNSLMAQERELLSNVLDCMRMAVMARELKEVYCQMHGDQMMLCLLKTKSEFSEIALKVIASSLIGGQGGKMGDKPQGEVQDQLMRMVVESLMGLGILKYVPPMLLRQGICSTDAQTQSQLDQCTLQILYSLIKYTSAVGRVRVESKLCQKRWQKLQRIFQLRNQYIQDQRKDEEQGQGQGNNDNKQEQEERGITAQEYIAKLKEGLSIVQLIDKIILSLLESSSTLKQRLITLLSLHGIKPRHLSRTLRQNYKFIGDPSQKKYLQTLLARVSKL